MHLGDGQSGRGGGVDAGTGPAPADAGAALPQRATEVGRDRLELGGLGPAQARGQGGDLGLARAGARDGGGRVDDLEQANEQATETETTP